MSGTIMLSFKRSTSRFSNATPLPLPPSTIELSTSLHFSPSLSLSAHAKKCNKERRICFFFLQVQMNILLLLFCLIDIKWFSHTRWRASSTFTDISKIR